jgi:hypothetical protein
MFWHFKFGRTAHQELSDRVLKQFNNQLHSHINNNSHHMQASSSVSKIDHGGPRAHRVSDHESVMDLGYGNPHKVNRHRPEFRLDNLRSESDNQVRRKAKKLPPI